MSGEDEFKKYFQARIKATPEELKDVFTEGALRIFLKNLKIKQVHRNAIVTYLRNRSVFIQDIDVFEKIIGKEKKDLKALLSPSSLDPSKEVSIVSWNLQHANEDYKNEQIQKNLAEILQIFDIMVLIELSHDAPLTSLNKLLPDHTHTPPVPMGSTGFYGAIFYREAKVTLMEGPIKYKNVKDDDFERLPFTFQFSVGNWKSFYITGVHLTAEDKIKDITKELDNLKKISSEFPKSDLIFVGDFNMRLNGSKPSSKRRTRIGEVLKAIKQIGYVELVGAADDQDQFIKGTMASIKNWRINDNILVTNAVKKNRYIDESAITIRPKFMAVEVGEYTVQRTKDYERMKISLFTDHYPVTATFSTK